MQKNANMKNLVTYFGFHKYKFNRIENELRKIIIEEKNWLTFGARKSSAAVCKLFTNLLNCLIALLTYWEE